jgi:Zn-dependent protease
VSTRASLLVCYVRGIPIYAHVTLPIGMAIISQFRFRPSSWLGLLVVVLVHELGHAFLLRRYQLPVLRIVVHGFGGECQSEDWITPWQRAVVAWGGVLAQLGLFAFINAGASLRLWPRAFTESDIYFVLTASNVLIAVFNLLPLRGLDGSEAWRLFRLGYLRGKRAWLMRRLHRLKSARRH